jgi:hypothetical protein
MTKLDFSQAKVQSVGVAYTSMKVTVNTKTKQQLEEEESIGQTSDTSKTSNTQKPNDKTISPNDNEQTVIFADPTNGNLVKLNLSNKNIEKLKSHFSNEDFYERKDKTLRLNGEAEAYVSGWFGDIAYKREFLKADADNDGKLSEGEYQNTRNGYLTIGEAKGIGNKVLSVTETVTETYTTPHTKRPEQGESVEAMLDFTLNADKNQDGQLSNMEYLESIGGYKNLLIDNARKHLENDPTLGKDYFSGGAQTDADLELLALQMRATQKLLASNGNENILTAEEREALGTELSIIKQSFKRKKELQEVKDEVVSKTEETRFLDTVG